MANLEERLYLKVKKQGLNIHVGQHAPILLTG